VECLAGFRGRWRYSGAECRRLWAGGCRDDRARQVLDLESLVFAEMAAAECGFAYRTSIFNSTARGDSGDASGLRLRPAGGESALCGCAEGVSGGERAVAGRGWRGSA